MKHVVTYFARFIHTSENTKYMITSAHGMGMTDTLINFLDLFKIAIGGGQLTVRARIRCLY
jgi:hypothetical protein